MAAVHLFVPRFRVDECLAEIRECLEKGWTGAGFKTVEFEEAWKSYTGLPHAHFVNYNTAGLHLALEVLKRRSGWEQADEVITTPLTFVSTNHTILHAGLTPVFADVDESLCLSPDSVAARITPRTRAVMFVGFGGSAGNYHAVLDLCRTHNLAMILDAAHMAGTRVAGCHAGHGADAAVFSFQAVKNLPTGDSGMVCFQNPEDDATARRLSWLGIDKDTFTRTHSSGIFRWRYEVTDLGYKYAGNSVMAAIGLAQLNYLDQDNQCRRHYARWYRNLLGNDERVRLIPVGADCESSTHLFQIRVANRDALMMYLNQNGVFPGVHYRDNTEYTMYASSHGRCPNAHLASRELISLPLHLHLTLEDVRMVADLVRRGLG